LLFSGDIWNYYFSQFYGVFLLLIAILVSNRRVAQSVLALVVCLSLLSARGVLVYSPDRFDSSSWRLLQRIASEALTIPDSGYFVYSQDQFAYPLKYAFSFYAKQHAEVPVEAYVKKPLTVLVKSADDLNNPYSTSLEWQKNKLHITNTPFEAHTYAYGYTVERFALQGDDLSTPIDPNLILDLHFR